MSTGRRWRIPRRKTVGTSERGGAGAQWSSFREPMGMAGGSGRSGWHRPRGLGASTLGIQMQQMNALPCSRCGFPPATQHRRLQSTHVRSVFDTHVHSLTYGSRLYEAVDSVIPLSDKAKPAEEAQLLIPKLMALRCPGGTGNPCYLSPAGSPQLSPRCPGRGC